MFNNLTKLISIQYKDLKHPLKGRSYGLWIQIDNKYKNDKGLLAHEREHARQFLIFFLLGLVLTTILVFFNLYNFLPLAVIVLLGHNLLYGYVRPYRYWSEMKAYGYSVLNGRSRASVRSTLERDYNLPSDMFDNFDEDMNKMVEKAKKDFEELSES